MQTPVHYPMQHPSEMCFLLYLHDLIAHLQVFKIHFVLFVCIHLVTS